MTFLDIVNFPIYNDACNMYDEIKI